MAVAPVAPVASVVVRLFVVVRVVDVLCGVHRVFARVAVSVAVAVAALLLRRVTLHFLFVLGLLLSLGLGSGCAPSCRPTQSTCFSTRSRG